MLSFNSAFCDWLRQACRSHEGTSFYSSCIYHTPFIVFGAEAGLKSLLARLSPVKAHQQSVWKETSSYWQVQYSSSGMIEKTAYDIELSSVLHSLAEPYSRREKKAILAEFKSEVMIHTASPTGIENQDLYFRIKFDGTCNPFDGPHSIRTVRP